MSTNSLGGKTPAGPRTGAGGLSGRSGGQPSGGRTGSGGLAGGSEGVPSGNRTGSGGLAGGSEGVPSGNRTGSGGLSGRSGGLPNGGRTGEGGLSGGSEGLPSGNRTGEGGLAGGSGGLPNGGRTGEGGLNASSGGPPAGERVGTGGLNGRESRAIPSGNRVGGGGLGSSRLTFSSLSGSAGRSGSSLGGSDGGGLGGGGRPFGGGRRRSRVETDNFRHIVCGSPVSATLTLAVSQSYDAATGRSAAPVIATWRVTTQGTDWTPENWKPCTVTGVGTPDYDVIGQITAPATSTATTQSKPLTGYPVSNGCDVHFDAPSSNGRVISRYTETDDGIYDTAPMQIVPSIPGTTVFVEPFTLSFPE